MIPNIEWVNNYPKTINENGYGTHHNASKENCPRCGLRFATRINKSGVTKGKIHRWCRYCTAIQRRNQ